MDRDTQPPTLTERVEKIEAFISGVRDAESIANYWAEREMLAEKIGGVRLGTEEYRRAQQDRNQWGSEAIHQAKVAQQSTFDEITHRVHQCADRVSSTAGKLEDIGNRIFGMMPEEGSGKGEAHREPEGSFEHAIRALDYLDETLIRLQRAAVRIERV